MLEGWGFVVGLGDVGPAGDRGPGRRAMRVSGQGPGTRMLSPMMLPAQADQVARAGLSSTRIRGDVIGVSVLSRPGTTRKTTRPITQLHEPTDRPARAVGGAGVLTQRPRHRVNQGPTDPDPERTHQTSDDIRGDHADTRDDRVTGCASTSQRGISTSPANRAISRPGIRVIPSPGIRVAGRWGAGRALCW